MSFYKVAYQVGFTPWEQAAQEGPVARQLSGLFDREQAEREPPYGKALDLGCGTGDTLSNLRPAGGR
ncbi:MAG: hypothetical protein H0V97_12310 [Actinobacteria bacterium]|nr:hypothetical protein [Actinomycetota bacterium]